MNSERPTVIDNPEMGMESLDHYCWILVSDLDNFLPFDEMLEKCTPEGANETAASHEKGYHAGALSFTENHIEHLVYNGVDVLARAQRYVESTEGLVPLDDAVDHCQDGKIAKAYERSDLERKL